ncbi:MAG: hypothetical protein HDT13_02450 [Butyrivibrio sp.]|nr:hypothetical protein [Butyrivibrio sp.]
MGSSLSRSAALHICLSVIISCWHNLGLSEHFWTSAPAYEAASVAYIRERYSQDDENKVIREYLANPADKAEFDEYDGYVMECKARAKAEIYGEGV